MKILIPSVLPKQSSIHLLDVYNEKLCITTQEGKIVILKDDISFLQAESNYCFIKYRNTQLFCSQTMKKIASRIQNPSFVRIHNSYIVNFKKIKFFDSRMSYLIMEDGTEIPIARTKKQIVKRMISVQFD